ncbi:hypothetical protein DDZ13_14225 [Coraliomargarita sinensis]|uniref:Uncharacterized protein n=1 Tax=Coraliomargarita sinensis TaxID=2174842 RepID=A0A317ZH08_9BACT|nr:hypothetical protein DDZ13_14225 [Coraliomargarita sinensis]
MGARLLEWCSSTRSGVWQWHEGISEKESEKIRRLLAEYASQELEQWYQFGEKQLQNEKEIEKLDQWLDSNEGLFHDRIWSVVNPDLLYLKEGEG